MKWTASIVEKNPLAKFHGFSGSREVCIQFFDTSKNNRPDGQTWVVLNDKNNVSTSSGLLDMVIDYGENGTSLEKAFVFNVSKIEFTNDIVDAHPESSKLGKEQWQLIKIYGTNP